MHDRVLKYARMETFELCLDCKKLAWSRKNRSETVRENEEGSVFVVGEE